MTKRDSIPAVGRRLAAARLRRAMSQGSVARRAGIAPSYLSRLETGKIHPTFRTVARIAAALRLPLDELTAGPQAKTPAGACPVTSSGHCLLDLIRPDSYARRPAEEAFSPRQVRLLQRLAAWMQSAPPERMRAIEIVIEEFARKDEPRKA